MTNNSHFADKISRSQLSDVVIRQALSRGGQIKFSKTNYQIDHPKIQVIDESGKLIGEMETRSAIISAKEKGLDLVLITEKVNPPIARFLNSGKFKYEQEKQIRKQRAKQKTIQIKEVRLTPNISSHDLKIRIDSIRRFIGQGNKVKLSLRIYGRNLQFTEDKIKMFESVCEDVSDIATIEGEMKREMNSFMCFLKPK